MEDQLLGPVLRSVSRSFYLSIRLLPSGLRQPVGLAYLLARATDTLADTHQIPAEIRRPQLERLASIIHRGGRAEEVEAVRSSFAPLQTNEAERRLIELLPDCLQMLERLGPGDQSDVRELLGKINRAQLMDLDTFGGTGEIRALATAADLDQYTYLIAGCVGEFWTRVGIRHVRGFADLPEEKMLELGRRYGTGLQLINILRDAGGDLRAGRCYLPNEELRAVGLEPAQVVEQPNRAMPVLMKWMDQAGRGLAAGMEYALAVRNRRIRGATALPALIGARTIALLRQAGDAMLKEKVKVPRNEVRGMLTSVAMTLASKRRLERMFRGNLG
jgi:farnesyl-diphosphate farnesyltransferase